MMRGVSDMPNPSEPGAGTPSGRAAGDVPPLPATPDRPPASVTGPPGPPAPDRPAQRRPLAGPDAGLSPTPPVPPVTRTAWGARLTVLLLAALGGVAGYLAATRFLPQWWARQIGDVSDGTVSAGVAAGLVCGVVFTLVPLLVLRGTVRRGATWTARLVILVLAVLLAVPNLITLGIELGTNSAAQAARDTFDREAPGFRGATLAGAVVGVLLAVSLWWLLWFLRRRRRQIAGLKTRLAEHEAASAPDRPGKDGEPRDERRDVRE